MTVFGTTVNMTVILNEVEILIHYINAQIFHIRQIWNILKVESGERKTINETTLLFMG
jgi:hypothetical protein